MKVLVADDNEDVRDLLREFLEDAGYGVRVAADGEEALRAFMAEPSHLVITDMRMPKCNGLQVMQAVKAARPGTPVILLTGETGAETQADRAHRLEAFACLAKPLKDIRAFHQAVADALALARV